MILFIQLSTGVYNVLKTLEMNSACLAGFEWRIEFKAKIVGANEIEELSRTPQNYSLHSYSHMVYREFLRNIAGNVHLCRNSFVSDFNNQLRLAINE